MNSITPPKAAGPVASIFATLLVGIVILALGLLSFGTLVHGWTEHELNKQFETEGIKVPAFLNGYEYVKQYGKGARSGDRPILVYSDQSGVTYKYLAIEYGVANAYFKKTLPTKAIEITYLRSNPSKARVEKWYSSSAGAELGMGVFLSSMCIFLISFLFKAYRKGFATTPEQ